GERNDNRYRHESIHTKSSHLDHRAEDRREDAALAHMKPGGIHLDDGKGAVRLEIHVQRPDGRQVSEDERWSIEDPEIGRHAEREIKEKWGGGSDEHRSSPPDPIGKRSVEHGREAVNKGSEGYD